MSRLSIARLRVCAAFAAALFAGSLLSGPLAAQEAATPEEDAEPAASSPECQWAGERILSLLWRDDIRTASDFLNLYDRFACPPDHVSVAFRCLVKIGVSPDQGDPALPRRASACWADPNLDAAKLKAETAAPAANGQAPAEGQPAEGAAPRDAAPQGDGQPAAPAAPKPAQ